MLFTVTFYDQNNENLIQACYHLHILRDCKWIAMDDIFTIYRVANSTKPSVICQSSWPPPDTTQPSVWKSSLRSETTENCPNTKVFAHHNPSIHLYWWSTTVQCYMYEKIFKFWWASNWPCRWHLKSAKSLNGLQKLQFKTCHLNLKVYVPGVLMRITLVSSK